MNNYTYIDEDLYDELLDEYADRYFGDEDPDKLLLDMFEFEYSVSHENILDVIRSLDRDFNPNDDYWYIDNYGEYCSTDDRLEYYRDNIDEDEFLRWCDENGYLDDYKDEEEEDEEEEQEDEE